MDLSSVKKILIVKPSSLGDIIDSLPVLKALKEIFPQAHISWVVNRQYSDILLGNPYLAQVIPFERKIGFSNFFNGIVNLWFFLSGLRVQKFDLCIDLQGLLRSGLISFFSGAKKTVGFANAREGSVFFYTHKVKVPNPNMHAVERYLLIPEYFRGSQAKLNICDYVAGVCDYLITENEYNFVRFLLNEYNERKEKAHNFHFVIVNPNSKRKIKRWREAYFANLCDRLQMELGLKVVLIGSKEEIKIVSQVEQMMRTKPINLAGKTSLRELANLIKIADLMITNDSGPMHIAAALGTPVIAIFGPTDPNRIGPTGPYAMVGSKKHTVISKSGLLPCIPCYRKTCEHQRCLDLISVEEVILAVKNTLAN